MDTSLYLHPEIIAGEGTISRAGAICAEIGDRILIITGPGQIENRNLERLISILDNADVSAITFDEMPAQGMADIAESAARLAQGARCSAVIGLGGIEAQSIARIAAVIAKSGSSVFDLLDGASPGDAFLPYIAIPSSGRDPFLLSPRFIALDPRDRQVKLMRAPPGLCAVTLVDSGLCEPLTGKYAPALAFDSFCAAVEACCSTRASFLSGPLLEQALILAARMMDAYAGNKTDALAETAVQVGLLTALGCAVSPPGIGTALAFALGGHFAVEKSWCAAVLLPHILEKLTASRPERLARIAELLGEAAADEPVSEAAAKVTAAIRRRAEALKLPLRLQELNLTLDRMVPAAEAARNLEFVAHSPWTVSAEDAYELLKRAF
ncbi:MAG: iron-containing alcohol dehydrogenase [Treponema sp.]|jgi:alcohol dehydrogenase|nr:iron-containing alcohol dehydrogenase [Treponema sp.]